MGSHHLQKKNLHSFILTQLDDGSHLEFYHVGFRHCHLGFRHLLIFSQIHSKTLSLHSDSWLKLIQSYSNLFILTQLDDGSHLEFGHLGFSHLSFSSQTHSHLPRLVPTICTKKTFTHSFWLNLMMAAILNSALLDSDTLLSSLRFTQKYSHSTLTLTQTYSIWLKLIHSDSTWWWQPSWIPPSWILPSWIQPFCTKLSIKLIQSDSNSFIMTQLDDGSHLEFCHLEFGHLGFSHLSFSSQTHWHLSRWVPTICTKKTFTHSFWLNLMMAATLNSTMLGSDTAILDSDPFLSSLRFTQKHSPSTLTLDSN